MGFEEPGREKCTICLFYHIAVLEYQKVLFYETYEIDFQGPDGICAACGGGG